MRDTAFLFNRTNKDEPALWHRPTGTAGTRHGG